jgi:hypothetical protein
VPSVGPARVPASREKSEGEAGDRGSADPAARGASSPAPIGKGEGPPASASPNWPKLIGEIRDALPFGPEKIQAVISAGLPKYDNKTTYGVLITNEGDIVSLESGEKDPRYSNYPPSSHVEGKAAIWIGGHGSTGGVVYHNNTDGTCGLCNSQVRTLLPPKKELFVVPPADAVAKKRGAIAYPKPYVGDDAIPKPPKQSDFFWKWP